MAESHREEIVKLEALYASNPGGRVFVHLAEAYRRTGEHERARRILEDGLARHADSVSGYVVLGRVLTDIGEATSAGAAFRRVLELDEGNLIALRSLGDMAREAGRLDEAERFYTDTLARNPSDNEVRTLLGTVQADRASAEDRHAATSQSAADRAEVDSVWQPGSGEFEPAAEAEEALADTEIDPGWDVSPEWGSLLADEEPISPPSPAPGQVDQPGDSLAEVEFGFIDLEALPGDLAAFADAADDDSASGDQAAGEGTDSSGSDWTALELDSDDIVTALDELDMQTEVGPDDLTVAPLDITPLSAAPTPDLDATPADTEPDDSGVGGGADDSAPVDSEADVAGNELVGDNEFVGDDEFVGGDDFVAGDEFVVSDEFVVGDEFAAGDEFDAVSDEIGVLEGEPGTAELAEPQPVAGQVIEAVMEEPPSVTTDAAADAGHEAIQGAGGEAGEAEPGEAEAGEAEVDEVEVEVEEGAGTEVDNAGEAGGAGAYEAAQTAGYDEVEADAPVYDTYTTAGSGGAGEAAADFNDDAGLNTETIAELYRSQGFHDRAADIYRALLRQNPGDQRLMDRLAAVEQSLAPSVRAGDEGQDAAEAPAGGEEADESEDSWLHGAGTAWVRQESAAAEATPYTWTGDSEESAATPPIRSYLQTLTGWRSTVASAAPEAAPAAESTPVATTPAEFPWDHGGGPVDAARAETPAEAAPAGSEAADAEPADPWTAGQEPVNADANAQAQPQSEPVRSPPAASTGDPVEDAFLDWYGGEPEGTGASEDLVLDETSAQHADDEEEGDDEDLEMFRTWLKSLKK